jgi:heterodisulfide reductase subunit A-like polyferredoxin
VKLRPVDFATEGIFLCGLAHSPACIDESIAQAQAAAARAGILLSKDRIRAKGIVVSVDEALCSGCGACVEICDYGALSIDEETGKAKVTEVLCQGCGACAAACPNGANQQRAFNREQMLRQIEAAVG